MGKFDGLYLFSDMDGTIITSDFTIPQKNIDAIKYFTENGGHFAFATGRGCHFATLDYMDKLGVNYPCILINGSLLFDPKTKQAIDVVYSDNSQSRELLTALCNKYSDRYIITAWLKDRAVQFGLDNPSFKNVEHITPEQLSESIVKLVFGHPNGIAPEDAAFVRSLVGDKLYITNASERFYEVMPKGMSKGFRLEWLINHYSLERKNVIAMGDYFNDYEMLSVEGIRSFCPDNAHDEIKKLCERTLCHVNDGAIAAAIEILDSER